MQWPPIVNLMLALALFPWGAYNVHLYLRKEGNRATSGLAALFCFVIGGVLLAQLPKPVIIFVLVWFLLPWGAYNVHRYRGRQGVNRDSDDPAPDCSFERPPLGIRHLMLWIACSAVFLGIVTAAATPGILVPLYCLSVGAGLAGLVVLRRSILHRYRLAPGEMLLQIIGLFFLATIVLTVGGALMKLDNDGLWENFGLSSFCFVLLFVFGAVLRICVWIKLLISFFRVQVWHWRLLFFVLFASPMLVGIYEFFPSIMFLAEKRILGPIVGLTLSGLLGIVGWLDWRQPTRYPWTHWVGLGSFGWLVLTYLVGAGIDWGT